MDYNEAIQLRDKNKHLIKQDYPSMPGYIIKDIVIANYDNISDVYMKMWKENKTNEEALINFPIKSYEVFIITHKFTGEGDLFFKNLSDYLGNLSQPLKDQ